MLRSFLGAIVIAAFLSAPAAAQDSADDRAHFIDHPLHLLFAQTAKAMTFDGETLVLEGIQPTTLFFADRPDRLTGHLSNDDFVQLWTRSAQSFSADPPNAALALLEESNIPPVVVELKSVTLEGDSLHYKVRVLDGKPPERSGAVSLFIDPWVWVPRHDVEGGPPGWLQCHWNPYGVRVCNRLWL